MQPLTYSSVVTLMLNATQTSRVENLLDRASGAINPSELADLRLPDLTTGLPNWKDLLCTYRSPFVVPC